MIMPQGLGNSTASSEFAIVSRLSKVVENTDLANSSILDIGCNDAAYTVELARSAKTAVGIDLDSTRLNQARHRAKAGGVARIRIMAMNAEMLGFRENSFDVVFVNEVLEHIPDQEQALDEIHRVLRPGGRFVLFAPNRFYPFETHGARIASHKFGRFVPIVHWMPRFIGRHFLNARSYTPRGLAHLLGDHSLAVVHQSCLFPPFDGLHNRLKRYHLAFLVDLYRKLIPVCAKIPGLRSMGLSVFLVAKAV